jgi:hypothetical protein
MSVVSISSSDTVEFPADLRESFGAIMASAFQWPAHSCSRGCIVSRSRIAEASSFGCHVWKNFFPFVCALADASAGSGRERSRLATVRVLSEMALYIPLSINVPSGCRITFSIGKRDIFVGDILTWGSFLASSRVHNTDWGRWEGRFAGRMRRS